MGSMTENIRARYEHNVAHDWSVGPQVFHPECSFTMADRAVRAVGDFTTEHDVWNKAFPDLSHKYIDAIESPDGIAFELMMTATHTGPFRLSSGAVLPPTGRTIRFYSCHFARVRDGLVVDDHIYQDPSAAMVQLGLVPVVTPAGLDWQLP